MNGTVDFASPEVDGRSDSRSNMFIAAAMYAYGVSSPVKVRNMSSTGALVETSVSPSTGSTIRLSRGSLLVSGEVVWSAGNRCGLRFDSLITVKDWIAPPANIDQAQVDAMVAEVRAKAEIRAAPIVTGPSSSKSAQAGLALVAALIEELGDVLSSDPATVASHGIELQKIDKALQLIAALQKERP